MRFSSLFCFRRCCFSWRGRRSLSLWEMGLEEEAAIPRDCPIHQGKAVPPREKSGGGEG